jgi:dihydrofolate reductase
MIISLVVAAATNNAIGLKGQLPWNLPNDLKHFKNVTWGMPIIMGRKTFESLGKPLKGRKNIVISRQMDTKDGIVVVKSLEDALFVAGQTDAKEAMVIGGGEIFRQVFEKADRIYLTRIETAPEADTFFPVIDDKLWHLMSRKDYQPDEKNAYSYSFQTWERFSL